MDKIIPIWKPINFSSYDVVRYVKKYIKNEKIGHCGTLDPFAEGVLVLCVGSSTKKVSQIMEFKKKYKTTIILGEETDTLDLTGKIIKKNPKQILLDRKKVETVIESFIGNYKQIPPYYSAKKINGVKMYDLARKNIFIKRRPSIVKIYNIKLNSLDFNKLNLTIECGKGTYIRSLTRDIAYRLKTYGYVYDLIRTNVGIYTQENSININEIENVIKS